jgi:quercetin dioxygenase-like cupin family protein
MVKRRKSLISLLNVGGLLIKLVLRKKFRKFNRETTRVEKMTEMTDNKDKSVQSAQHYSWGKIPREQLNNDIDRRFITGTNMMIAQIYLKEGGVAPNHSHKNEQITYVLEGALKFLLGEDQQEQVILRAGEVLVIPPHLPHSAVALEDTLDVDIFNPPREDWLDGSDAYLRGGKPHDIK